MHLAGRSYEEAYRTFRWELPQRFNIAAAICDRHASAMPDAPALIYEELDGRTSVWSFARLQQAANRLANVLTSLGVGRGTIVGLHLPQCPESPVAHIAIQKLGAVALPLFTLFGPEAISYRLANSGASVLITNARDYERMAEAIGSAGELRHVITLGSAVSGAAGEFWKLCEQASDGFATVDTAADAPALLMYTSGTTGNPKGVLHAGRTLIGHLPGVMLPLEMFPQPGDRAWTPADWAWAGGLLDILFPSLYCGVPVVASARTKFDPDWAFAFIGKHGIRNAFIPPTALRLMRQVPNPGARHVFAMRSISSGGEKLGADMLAWGEETFGLNINEFYGQTEVNVVVANSRGLYPPLAGSMGRAVPGHVVEIVDEAGRVLPPGEKGIVAVKRPDPVMFLEYWKNPEATADKFRGDWCLLGDVASKDESGYFWFEGRNDDIIISAGYRIGPSEVEDCLAKHPAVALAGVVGVPDSVRGEVVAAFVVPAQGHTPSAELAVDIQNFVKERLAAHEYPRKVRFLDEMPMTVTGKIRRVDLRKLDSG